MSRPCLGNTSPRISASAFLWLVAYIAKYSLTDISGCSQFTGAAVPHNLRVALLRALVEAGAVVHAHVATLEGCSEQEVPLAATLPSSNNTALRTEAATLANLYALVTTTDPSIMASESSQLGSTPDKSIPLSWTSQPQELSDGTARAALHAARMGLGLSAVSTSPMGPALFCTREHVYMFPPAHRLRPREALLHFDFTLRGAGLAASMFGFLNAPHVVCHLVNIWKTSSLLQLASGGGLTIKPSIATAEHIAAQAAVTSAAVAATVGPSAPVPLPLARPPGVRYYRLAADEQYTEIFKDSIMSQLMTAIKRAGATHLPVSARLRVAVPSHIRECAITERLASVDIPAGGARFDDLMPGQNTSDRAPHGPRVLNAIMPIYSHTDLRNMFEMSAFFSACRRLPTLANMVQDMVFRHVGRDMPTVSSHIPPVPPMPLDVCKA
jgi:hypothetical protein